MLHGAGICIPTFTQTKSPSHVGLYIPAPFSSHMGITCKATPTARPARLVASRCRKPLESQPGHCHVAGRCRGSHRSLALAAGAGGDTAAREHRVQRDGGKVAEADSQAGRAGP